MLWMHADIYIFCFIVVAVAVSINTIYYFTLVYSTLPCTSIFTGRMGSQFCTFFLSTCYTGISIYKRINFSVYCIIVIFHVCNLSNSIKTLWLTIKLMVPCLHSVMVWHWECLISENSSVDQGLLYCFYLKVLETNRSLILTVEIISVIHLYVHL